jgi:hypothetical protein
VAGKGTLAIPKPYPHRALSTVNFNPTARVTATSVESRGFPFADKARYKLSRSMPGQKRGRADAYYGNAIIEFEKSLAATLEEAKRQLCEYVAGVWQKENRKSLRPLLAVASDGIRWISYRPVLPDGEGPTPESVVLDELRDFQSRRRQSRRILAVAFKPAIPTTTGRGDRRTVSV